MDDTLIKYSQLGDIFDFFSMGVMVLSPEREILSLNQSAEVISGYKASDLVGQNCRPADKFTLRRQLLLSGSGGK